MDIAIRKKLLCNNYDKTIRPQEKVEADFEFTFKTFDFQDNMITVQSWINLRWNDSRLMWDPKDFEENVKTYAAFDLLWVPDIALLES
jgi:hypothetical protein